MTRILHLDSSARRHGSLSRELSRFYVDQVLAVEPGADVVYRDLAHEQLPLVSDEWVSAAFSPPDGYDANDRFALDRSDGLIGELLAADLVVVGAPVYNFSVPAALKAWIDLVARVGRTFVYGPDGVPHGLLGDKRVVVAASSGSGPRLLAAMGMDHHDSYLRGFFAFLGITDVQVVAAWGRDAATVAQTVAAARTELLGLVVPPGPPAPRDPADDGLAAPALQPAEPASGSAV